MLTFQTKTKPKLIRLVIKLSIQEILKCYDRLRIILEKRGRVMSYEIFYHDEKVTEINPVVSGKAPDFSLVDQNGEKIQLSSLTKPVLISVFPNINTRVCSLQTKHFNVEASKHFEIDFLSISNNTAEEQKNWCAAEGVDMTLLADDGTFGKAYGLIMPDGPLAGRLARSVFVVKNGELIYHEILKNISQEPNYAAALSATLG